jgi:WD40 repeat protein
MASLGIGLLMTASRRAASSAAASIGSANSGVIDFTTYSPPTVQRVSYLYRHGQLQLGTPAVIAHLQNADGLAYTPSGQLVIGGQSSGLLTLLAPSGATVGSVPSGVSGAFLVALAPSGKTLYTAGLPGSLAEVVLDPLSPGHAVTLSGDDPTITDLAFGPSGQALYTSSPSEGRGDIGLLDIATGSTHRLFSNISGAHGIMYDPFSGSYLIIGGDSILQVPAGNPSQIISELTVPGMQFDQGAVTGRGNAFFASNTGSLVMIDYASTGRIGEVANVIQTRFLAPHLDDVAPLIGPGARPVLADTSTLRRAGESSLVAAVALSVLVIVGHIRRRSSRLGRNGNARRLPSWDKRRKSGASPNWVSGPIDDIDLFR